MDGHQNVRRRLAHHNARSAHGIRQKRLGHRDAVLHQDLGIVWVGAELEGDGDGQLAIAGGVRGHVFHVLNAIDLRLDGGGDRVGQHLCRGAGKAC